MPTEFCAVEWASSPSGGAIPQPLSLVVLLVGQWRIVLWYDPAFARYVNLVMRNVLAGHLAGPFLIWHIWEDWVIRSIFTHFYYVGNILSCYYIIIFIIIIVVLLYHIGNWDWKLSWLFLGMSRSHVAVDYGVVRLRDEDWECPFNWPLLGFVCGSLIVGGFCLCVCLSGDCVTVVSTQFIFSSFGCFKSSLLGSSMAKKRPRPAEVLSCVAIKG